MISCCFFSSLISLIADGPHHYHSACGLKGSSHLSPVHALQFFIAMQVQHSYNSSTNNGQLKVVEISSIMSGRSLPLYCTLTLIAMQGHQTKNKHKTETMYYIIEQGSNNIILFHMFFVFFCKASSWHLNGYLDGSNLGSTI